MIKWLFYLITGGRPMKRLGYDFTDAVTGEAVCYYLDGYGREWLATGAWSGFRMKSNMTFAMHIQGVCDTIEYLSQPDGWKGK